MNFDISIIDSLEALEQFVPEWLAFLDTEPMGARVYNHPHYMLAQYRNFPEENANRQFAVIVVKDQGKIVCIAPLTIQKQPFRLELSTKQFFPVRIRKMICPGGSFVFAPEDPAKIFSYFDAVFDTIRRLPIRFDLFVLFGIRNYSPFWDYCLTRLTGKSFRCYNVLAEPQSDLRIHLPDSMETLLASIDKKQRYNVRRTLKYFHESVKEFRLERITERSQVESFFNTMAKIAANSWQGKTFGLTDQRTETRLNYWKEIADLGFLRSYILWADDKPIAYRLSYLYNGIYEGQMPGYDLAAAELHPGIVCLYYCLDDLMTYKPARICDFDFGTLGNKRIFANEEIESTVVFISGSAKGTVLAFFQRFLNQCVFGAKKLLTKWGLADQIRQLLKKKK